MKAKRKPRSKRVASDDGLERKRYTLWTCPPEAWTKCFDGLVITPQMEIDIATSLEKVDKEKIKERTKAFCGNSYFAL